MRLATRSNSKSSENVLQITRARVVENSDKKTEIDLEIKLKNWSVLENIQWKSFIFLRLFVLTQTSKLYSYGKKLCTLAVIELSEAGKLLLQ